MDKLKNTIEAILFVSGDPVSVESIVEVLDVPKTEVLDAISALSDEYEVGMRGLRLVMMEDMVQMASREIYAEAIETVLSPVRRQTLSRSVIETLSIIAYKQPITRSEVAEIRGVRCDYAVSVLHKRGLICEVGRKDALGRPILYGTTELFLRDFNLENIAQLPEVNFDAVSEAIESQQPDKENAEAEGTEAHEQEQFEI